MEEFNGAYKYDRNEESLLKSVCVIFNVSVLAMPEGRSAAQIWLNA